MAEVQTMVEMRVAAIAANDVDAWLATTAGDGGASLRAREAQRFASLQDLPVTDVGMTLLSVTGPPEAAVAQVKTSYRLAGAPPAEHTDAVDIVSTPDGWRLGESEPVVAVADGGTLPPWYLAGVRAQSLADVGTVLSWPDSGQSAEQVARLATDGARAAFGAVGRAPQGVLIAVPDTIDTYQALVPGTGEAGSGFAAVTADVAGPGAGGDLVVVNPEVWPELDGRERQVVLTHELVHVAVGTAVGGGQPLWLAEGYADHVALAPVLESGVTRQQLAGGLLADIAAGVGPADLPVAEDFSTGGERAYTVAWLAVDYAVRTHGEQAVLDLQDRLSGVGQSAGPGVEDAALRRELGVTRDQLVAGWLADLAAQATSVAVPVPAPAQ